MTTPTMNLTALQERIINVLQTQERWLGFDELLCKLPVVDCPPEAAKEALYTLLANGEVYINLADDGMAEFSRNAIFDPPFAAGE